MAGLRKITALLALLAAPALAAPGPGRNPGVGPVDPRHPIDVAQPPWRGLCRVQTELGTRCTGFLVGPDRVMTAAHCLWLPRVGRFAPPRIVHVLLRYADGRWAAHGIAEALAVAPGYDPGREAGTAGRDWAVITLHAPLGRAEDALPLLAAPPAPGADAMLAGYGRDRAEHAVADTGCHILARSMDASDREVLAHDCAATKGSSGAPLLVRGSDGRWAAAGVQALARPDAAGGFAARF